VLDFGVMAQMLTLDRTLYNSKLYFVEVLYKLGEFALEQQNSSLFASNHAKYHQNWLINAS